MRARPCAGACRLIVKPVDVPGREWYSPYNVHCYRILWQ